MAGSVYRMSNIGRKALESKDASVPSDYRTILWVMEFQGADHLKPLMAMYPEQRLSDCLAEMKELGFIEEIAGTGGDTTVVPSVPQEIVAVAANELVTARDALSQHGAYLAESRLKDRRRVDKAASEIAILIVEDDADQPALADVRVSMAGYGVRVADSQAAMLRSMAEEGAPDLILLDVTLADGDGFDILARMRSLPSFTSLPIVMLTAKTVETTSSRESCWGLTGTSRSRTRRTFSPPSSSTFCGSTRFRPEARPKPDSIPHLATEEKRGRKVLIVDDEESMRELLRLHLGNSGYQVTVAEDAMVAGHLLLKDRPDLMIVDVGCPI